MTFKNLPVVTRCVKPKFTVSEPPFFRRDGQMPKQNLKQALAVSKACIQKKHRSTLDPECVGLHRQIRHREEEMGFMAMNKSC